MAQISFNLPSDSALVVSKSANWDTAYTYVTSTSANSLILQGVSAGSILVYSNSAKWDTTYSWVTGFSSNPTLETLHVTNSAYIQNKLGVGVQLPLWPLHVVGNTLVEGNLTATGVVTYLNTNTTTFTALSVDNGGSTSSLFVKQRGNFAIADFKDGEVTALYIDGHSDRPGYVGVRTVTPNVEFTVSGRISATDFIYSPNIGALQSISAASSIVQTHSANWDTAYSYVTGTSANLTALQSLSAASSIVQTHSASWDTAYSYVTGTSANLTVLQSISAGASLVQTHSANWDSAYTVTNNTSANLITLQATSAVVAASVINYIIDGGGSSISTGSKGVVVLPCAFQVTEWTICSNINTSITVDVLSATIGTYPATNSITKGTQLSLVSQSVSRSTVSWGKLSAGDVVEFVVTAPSNATMVTVALKGVKS